MSRLVAFLLILAVFLAAGCTDPRGRAEALLREQKTSELRHEAAVVYKQLYARPVELSFVEMPPKEWPKSFRALQPLRVGAYPDGIALTLAADQFGEAGVFIVPESMDVQPRRLPGSEYEEMKPGVFWYRFRQAGR